MEQAFTYLEKAEGLDLEYLQRKPGSISAHLSLARTYRLMGESVKGQEQIVAGLENARARVKRKPESSSSAYWLGKTLEMAGNLPEAANEYQRAMRLRPGELKYQKAALRLSKFSVNEDEDRDDD